LELKKEFDIVVCGDSFSSATKNGNPRTNTRDHYSQILQDQYGYSVLCLARSSMTNLGIAWQMRQAIEIGCKFLLYHNTWSIFSMKSCTKKLTLGSWHTGIIKQKKQE